MPSAAAATASKTRRIPTLIVFAFVTAAVAFFTRNHGGIVGFISSFSASANSSSSSSAPTPPEIPNWMSQPFDKQAPLTHTVHPYADHAHTCCKKGSIKCLKVPPTCYFIDN
jgi:hypothetical protein